jgi:hypothetical protein
MILEQEVKRFERKLYSERDRLTRDLGRINHIIDAFSVNGANHRGPQPGRKLSKAHRLAIKRGIAAAKKEKK